MDKKRIAMLVEQDFEDVEVSQPLKELREAGFEITLVGSGSQDSYTGKRHQTTVKPDILAEEVNVRDYDALFIPGGYAPDKMRMHSPMVELVKKFNDANKWIFALCHGPQLLISADVVRGKKVTSWPSVAVDLKNAGGTWVDEPVVVDGRLITSRKPADIPELDKKIVEVLTREPAAVS